MQYKKTEKYSRVAKSESRELIKGAGRKEALDRQPLIHASTRTLISYSKAPRSKLLDLDMKVQSYQKITQQVHKIKSMGVLRQSHVYMIK